MLGNEIKRSSKICRAKDQAGIEHKNEFYGLARAAQPFRILLPGKSLVQQTKRGYVFSGSVISSSGIHVPLSTINVEIS